jgi:serine/threonine-protein kinase
MGANDGGSSDPVRVAHYRITGRIGRGGMGIVYRAEDDKLGRAVALKVLPPALASDDERRRRFLREARTAASINDPHVAAVYDVGQDGEHAFLAMELVEGETLRNRLERGPLPVAEAIDLARQIALGLREAHGKGIVHRDLKPENVMVTTAGRAKILDFGLAKLRAEEAIAAPDSEEQSTATQQTLEGQVLGTPGYMAPEQAAGRPVDARSDVFSFGVMLYELLSGARPFDAPSRVEQIVKLSRDPHRPLREIDARIGPAVERVVDRCLAKDPARRYASAAELLVDLERLGAAPAASPRRARVALAAALALGAVATVGLVLHGRAPSVPAPGGTPPGSQQAPSASASAASGPVESFLDATSAVPEALLELRQGVQAQRDMMHTAALKHFARAEQLDPELGPAYLREIVNGGRSSIAFRFTSIHESFQLAFQHRASLSAAQRELLDAVEPWAREPPALAEAETRLLALGGRYPRDVDVPLLLGTVRGRRFDPAGVREAADWALRLRPDVAASWNTRARALMLSDDVRGAIDAHQQCLRIAPSAAGCMANMARGYDVLGQCADAERVSEHLVATDPALSATFESRALYLYGAGKPLEAVRAAYERYLSGLPDEDRPRIQVLVDVQLDLARGDLAAASARLPLWERRLQDDPDVAHHRWLAETHAQIAVEEGKPSEAVRVVQDFLAHREGWVNKSASQEDFVISLLALEHQAGGDVGTARDTWIASERERAASAGILPAASEGTIWNKGIAAFARTPDEARAALALMPDAGLPATFRRDDLALGRAFLRAGRIDEAVDYLNRSARFCDRLGHVILSAWAQDLYAQALEAKGDTTAACKAFGIILDRWPNPVPRSVTVEHARARTRALSCAR